MSTKKLIAKTKSLDEVYNSFMIVQGANEILDHPELSDFDDAEFGNDEDRWLEFLFRIEEISPKGVEYKGFLYKVKKSYLYIYK